MYARKCLYLFKNKIRIVQCEQLSMFVALQVAWQIEGSSASVEEKRKLGCEFKKSLRRRRRRRTRGCCALGPGGNATQARSPSPLSIRLGVA